MAQIIQNPYELLIRWDESGNLQGASIAWRKVVLDDDGKEDHSTISQPEAIAIGKQKGFPLADILSKLHVTSLSTIETHEATIEELNKVIQDRNIEISSLLSAQKPTV